MVCELELLADSITFFFAFGRDMKTEHDQDEVTWDTLARNLLEKSSAGSSKLKDRVEYVCT